MHSDLLKGEPAIRDEMQRLEAVKSVCENVRDRYRDVITQAEANLEKVRGRQDEEVDELVCSTTVVYNQLIDLIAEDNALEDTIYHLSRGLNSGTASIDLDRFLKRVRALALEQFMKRALINKILLEIAIARASGELGGQGGRSGNGNNNHQPVQGSSGSNMGHSNGPLTTVSESALGYNYNYQRNTS